jgi:3-hydroxyisobutyrate dehydrogenase
MRVGYIGLGSQGAPIAGRIIQNGHPTTLWARRAATLEPFVGTGARFADSPAELASASDLICLCVVNDADVREVFDAMYESISPGTILAVQSTVHPDTCIELAQRAALRDAIVIDAPVSGGGEKAAAGELLVIVGGDRTAFETAREIFDTYGDPVVHIGPLGTAQLAKLINNAIFMANITLGDDALRIGETFGLDQNALTTVITQGSGNSYGFAITSSMGMEALGEAGSPTLRKDVDIVTAVSMEKGADVGVLIDVANEGLKRMGRPAS